MIKLFFIAMVIVSSLQLQATDSSNQSNNFSKIHSSQQLVASAMKKSPISEYNVYDAQVCGITKKNDALIAVKTVPAMQKIVALQYAKRRMIVPHMGEHEGFVENSLIKTPSGYQKIQDLEIGDIVYGSDNHEKIVIDTFEQQASQLICLTKDNEIIHVACHQKFYLPQQNKWIAAQDITSSDIVLSTDNQHISFDAIEIIDQNIKLYCITVQDHLFKISSQDILVHNMAVLTPQILTFICVELLQPVVYLLAASVSLRNVSTYSPFQEINGVITYKPSQEKTSFDYKYTTLESAKKELTSIYNALKAINYKLDDQKILLNFTPAKPNNLPSLSNINAQDEGKLNAEARKILTEYRQEKLEKLEEDICNLQIKIGLCVDECIYRKNETIKFYNELREQEIDPFYKTRRLNLNSSYVTVKKYYEDYLIYDMLMAECEDRMKEIESITKIFEKYNQNSIIAKTTNILPLLAIQKKNIEDNRATIKTTKIDNDSIKNILRGYFYNHQPLPDPMKEIAAVKATLHKIFKDTAQSRWQYIKYEKIVEPDKKPEDGDKEIPRKFVYDATYHGKFASATKSAAPKNGQAALDYSWKVSHHSRLGISESEFVVLMFTKYLPEGGSQWHGFAITWDTFKKDPDMQQIIGQLQRMKIISGNGKIL